MRLRLLPIAALLAMQSLAHPLSTPPPTHYRLTSSTNAPEVGAPFTLTWKTEPTETTEPTRGELHVYRLSRQWGAPQWEDVPIATVLTANDYAFATDFIHTPSSAQKTHGTLSLTLNKEGNYYFMLLPENRATAFTTKAIQLITKNCADKSTHPNAASMFTWKCRLVGDEAHITLTWENLTTGRPPFHHTAPTITGSTPRLPSPPTTKIHSIPNVMGYSTHHGPYAPSGTRLLWKQKLQNPDTIQSILPSHPQTTFESNLRLLPLLRKNHIP